MSKIRGQNTKPELEVRRVLWKMGYRYQLYRKDLPGKPDLVFPKYKAVIFINGCFWHKHGCRFSKLPATNMKFWKQKIESNCLRDKKNIEELKDLGWRVCIIWECAIRNKSWKTESDSVINTVAAWLHSNERFMDISENIYSDLK